MRGSLPCLMALAAAVAVGSPSAAQLHELADLAEVSVEADHPEDCSAELAGVCAASIRDHGTLDPGDDEVHAYRWVDEAVVRVDGGRPLERDAGLDTREVAVDQGAYGSSHDLWLDLNETLPPQLRRYARFEARDLGTSGWEDQEALLLVVIFPEPLHSPIWGPWPGIEVPVPSETTFTDPDHAYPVGKYGLNPMVQGDDGRLDTDALVGTLAVFDASCPLDPPVTPACEAWDAHARPAAEGAPATWAGLTPSLRLGFTLNRTAVEVGPEEHAAAATMPGHEAPASPAQTSGPGALRTETLGASPLGAFASPSLLRPSSPAATGAEAPPPVQVAGPASPLPPTTTGVLLLAGALGAAVAAALYHRIDRERVLQQATRRRIFDAVAATPGVRTGTLARQLSLDHKTVAGHVACLLQCGLVVAHGAGQQRLFIPAQAPSSEARLAVIVLGRSAALRVMEFLGRVGAADLTQLREELGLPGATASVTVAALEQAGLVKKRRIGRRLVVALRAAPPVPTPPQATSAAAAGLEGSALAP